ncbi:MAG: hypothetical protein L6Q94_17650 [Calditrichia bacterium]|nr:hypothetical protein [Calditrichia bacterium]
MSTTKEKSFDYQAYIKGFVTHRALSDGSTGDLLNSFREETSAIKIE